jgi:putative adenylate-forming enzyme
VSVNRVAVVKAYAQTRMAHAFLRTRADIDRHQARLWRRLAPALARTPALSALAGSPLSASPIVEPGNMRARPGDWNSLGLSADEIMAGAEAAEHGDAGAVRPGVHAGFSTGTSGARGTFLSSKPERARYLGQCLAKLLPGSPLRRRRIGLCLRANNALYRDVANAGPFEFRFFSLDAPAQSRASEIEGFAPDIFVAPSHVLAELALLATEGKFRAPPFERLLYGAEPMGAWERVWITEALGARPDPIYQATEGFLGSACSRGVLHLNEDSIAFEFDPIAGSDRFRPIVTDLRRKSQPIVRVRLDDIVQFRDTPCPCGSVLQAIQPVEGRVADIWRWDKVRIFPRQVEHALAEALSPPDEWRAVASPTGVSLACDGPRADQARAALVKLLTDAGAAQPVTVQSLSPESSPKRRRVQWRDV